MLAEGFVGLLVGQPRLSYLRDCWMVGWNLLQIFMIPRGYWFIYVFIYTVCLHLLKIIKLVFPIAYCPKSYLKTLKHTE